MLIFEKVFGKPGLSPTVKRGAVDAPCLCLAERDAPKGDDGRDTIGRFLTKLQSLPLVPSICHSVFSVAAQTSHLLTLLLSLHGSDGSCCATALLRQHGVCRVRPIRCDIYQNHKAAAELEIFQQVFILSFEEVQGKPHLYFSGLVGSPWMCGNLQPHFSIVCVRRATTFLLQ